VVLHLSLPFAALGARKGTEAVQSPCSIQLFVGQAACARVRNGAEKKPGLSRVRLQLTKGQGTAAAESAMDGVSARFFLFPTSGRAPSARANPSRFDLHDGGSLVSPNRPLFPIYPSSPAAH
jgi:hypothetical protein